MPISETSDLRYDNKAIKKLFSQTGDVVSAVDDFSVLFPEEFIAKGLAIPGDPYRLVSIYAIVKNNVYATSIAPIYIDLTPSRIDDIIIEKKPYIELKFEKDTIFSPNTISPRTDSFLYDIFKTFFMAGNIPFYIDYNQLSELLMETKKYSGSDIGNNITLFEILASMVSRSKFDLSKFWRYELNEKANSEGVSEKNMKYAGMNNIFYSYESTGSKLIGSYFEQGLVNSIAEKEKKKSDVVTALRY